MRLTRPVTFSKGASEPVTCGELDTRHGLIWVEPCSNSWLYKETKVRAVHGLFVPIVPLFMISFQLGLAFCIWDKDTVSLVTSTSKGVVRYRTNIWRPAEKRRMETEAISNGKLIPLFRFPFSRRCPLKA